MFIVFSTFSIAQINTEGKTPSDDRPISPTFLPPLLGWGKKPALRPKGRLPLRSLYERFPVASHGPDSPLVTPPKEEPLKLFGLLS
jgi:hypothetical protein